jgi:hypothetical protein
VGYDAQGAQARGDARRFVSEIGPRPLAKRARASRPYNCKVGRREVLEALCNVLPPAATAS